MSGSYGSKRNEKQPEAKSALVRTLDSLAANSYNPPAPQVPFLRVKGAQAMQSAQNKEQQDEAPLKEMPFPLKQEHSQPVTPSLHKSQSRTPSIGSAQV
jgi:hypothetical protein